MKPYDARLLKLAAEAKVRPPHCYHVWHAIASAPSAFDPAAFALFAMLEERHVLAIVAALRAGGMYPERRQTRRPLAGEAHGTRLPAAMQLPEDWLTYAQTKRKWDKATTEDVLADFIEHWSNRTDARAIKRDWTMTWQTWVRRDRRPDGLWSPSTDDMTFAERCEAIALNWEKMDNPAEAAKWRLKATSPQSLRA